MILKWAKENLSMLVKKPNKHQVAALCYRDSAQGKQVLLVTSRGSGKTILPKGWPMHDRSDSESALQEAYEEAGVRGTIDPPMVGSFVARKKLGKGFKVPINTDLYAIKVSHLDNHFPEIGQREVSWHNIDDAIAKIEDNGVGYLLKRWHEINP